MADGDTAAAYDAAGRLIQLNTEKLVTYPRWDGTYPGPPDTTGSAQTKTEAIRYYDGNGRELKRREKDCTGPGYANCTLVESPVKYFVRSSVFGSEVLSEVNSTGKKLKTFVRADNAMLAWQTMNYTTSTPQEEIRIEHWDASGMSRRMMEETEGAEDAPVENDPMGGNSGIISPYPIDEQPPTETTGGCSDCNVLGISPLKDDDAIRVDGQKVRFLLDGMAVDQAFAIQSIQSGTAYQFAGYSVRGYDDNLNTTNTNYGDDFSAAKKAAMGPGGGNTVIRNYFVFTIATTSVLLIINFYLFC